MVVRTLPGNFEKAGRAGFILDDYCTLPSSLDPLVLRQRQVLVGVVGAGWSRVSLWSRESCEKLCMALFDFCCGVRILLAYTFFVFACRWFATHTLT